jgi:hypothetical protein
MILGEFGTTFDVCEKESDCTGRKVSCHGFLRFNYALAEAFDLLNIRTPIYGRLVFVAKSTRLLKK